MYSRIVSIRNPNGLHARPASQFVACATGFQSEIYISKVPEVNRTYNAKSIVMVLSMGIYQGDQIEITASGADEATAVDTLADLIMHSLAD